MATPGKGKAELTKTAFKTTFTSTAELKVADKIVDQVMGQDDAVNIIKKAALQRRHV